MKSFSEYLYYREKPKFSKRGYFDPQCAHEIFRGASDFSTIKQYELQGSSIIGTYKKWLSGPPLAKISDALYRKAGVYSRIPMCLMAKTSLKFIDLPNYLDRKISNIYVVQLKKFSSLRSIEYCDIVMKNE